MARVYLDYNAATPLDPRVLEVYQDLLCSCWANPSSTHREGQFAKGLLSEARCKIARVFNVAEGNVIFFSSATEALNTAIRGILLQRGRHIITSKAEHAAVWQCCRYLEKTGARVSYVDVGQIGAPDPDTIEQAIENDTSGLVCMAVNNETGVLSDISAIGAIAQQYNIPFVVDAVAQLGKMPTTLLPGVSAMCCSSHKIYGPLGVGFAVVNNGVTCHPLLYGGSQERGRRAGTENVAAISEM